MNGTTYHKLSIFCYERKNSVSQWAFQLNSAPATAENWHLKGHIQKVNTSTITR